MPMPAMRERAAFQRLARTELPRPYALARRLCRDDAEDLVQECLLRAHRSFGSLRDTAGRALAEAARVLRPDGRLCVSDLTVEEDLPAEILTSDSAWAGCISGALSEDVFTTKLANVGFVDVEMSHRVPFAIDDVALYPQFTADTLERMHELIPPTRHDAVCVGVIVRATKPGDNRTTP